jgi:hypothetical protein
MSTYCAAAVGPVSAERSWSKRWPTNRPLRSPARGCGRSRWRARSFRRFDGDDPIVIVLDHAFEVLLLPVELARAPCRARSRALGQLGARLRASRACRSRSNARELAATRQDRARKISARAARLAARTGLGGGRVSKRGRRQLLRRQIGANDRRQDREDRHGVDRAPAQEQRCQGDRKRGEGHEGRAGRPAGSSRPAQKRSQRQGHDHHSRDPRPARAAKQKCDRQPDRNCQRHAAGNKDHPAPRLGASDPAPTATAQVRLITSRQIFTSRLRRSHSNPYWRGSQGCAFAWLFVLLRGNLRSEDDGPSIH